MNDEEGVDIRMECIVDDIGDNVWRFERLRSV